MEEITAAKGEGVKECEVEDDKATQIVIFVINDDVNNIF